MDIRRLQQTGGKTGKSFLIIVPKEWVSQHKLNKGDPVVVTEREDGCLIVDPRLPKGGETKSTTVHLESNLRWSITSNYLLGFDEIHIVGTDPITNDQREEVKRIIKRFVALEVTEEDDHEIVVQCLVDPSTIPVHKAMRRMNLVASRMVRDALTAFFDGNHELADDVRQRDEEVDRLFFLIVRELRSAIQYPSMAETMSIPPVEALDFRLAAQYIERIADLAVDVAATTEDALQSEVIKTFEPITDRVYEMLSKSVANLFRFDSDKVAWVMAAERELSEKIAELKSQLIGNPKVFSQSRLQMLDSVLRIGEAAKDIVDLSLPQS